MGYTALPIPESPQYFATQGMKEEASVWKRTFGTTQNRPNDQADPCIFLIVPLPSVWPPEPCVL